MLSFSRLMIRMLALSPHLLVIDDDARLRRLLQQFLREQGYCVSTAEDAPSARTFLSYFIVDLMVVDVMMPGETGLEFMQWLRGQHHDTPAIILSAMGEPEDRITGLEHGVDDYLPKPFEPRELKLRIDAILQRHRGKDRSDRAIHFGDFTYMPASGQLMHEGHIVYLTTGEQSLLHILTDRRGTAISRDQLSRLLGGSDNERSIDVQITRLRRKIEDNPRQPRFIQTVRGEGYVFHAI